MVTCPAFCITFNCSLTILFFDPAGENTVSEGLDYIVDRFKAAKNRRNKDFYIHYTCATDTKNIEFVFECVNDVIMKQNLRSVGLL